MSEKSRRQLIRHITEYQTSRFGENPTREQRQAIATATGFVFETLSAVSNKNSESISFFLYLCEITEKYVSMFCFGSD